ncbi:putative pyruvate decarboxylase [Pusillimonas sp. T7-7]|uniref:thiamine pyrophosphate-dependent enzyme n=1 Tax=Pusillimonas sp. (strain T7-7) TaxID=1007105 RepID=UPI0002084A34|nr:thiamine pyrophosphate-dependent enzyme [Pusillimonas sp. T7-7]AEC21080.1 putative pyruvate decarboxylase [Pusillimonas sp. T7-7]
MHTMPLPANRPVVNATSAHALLSIFAANGLDRVFLVPGESYLGVLDALIDFPSIESVVCRHESGAGYMAVADGRITGRPGVAMVSRGPGASNAAIAVHTAQQDAVPMILLVGQVPKRALRREAFQEINYGEMFGSIAKWVCEPTDPQQLAEAAFKAIRVASSGTPGPVVLVIPEDIQQQEAPQPTWVHSAHAASLPPDAVLQALQDELQQARRPLVIAGGMFERPGGREALSAFVEAWNIPVAVSFRRHDVYPSTMPLYAGELGLAPSAAQMEAFRESDLILALGTRLGDIPTQEYTFPSLPRPEQTLVHCYPDDHIVGLHYAADYGLVCDPVELVKALSASALLAHPQARQEWSDRLVQVHARHAIWPDRPVADGVDFSKVVRSLSDLAPDDAVVCLDAGTFAAPVYRHFKFRAQQRLLSPLAGAMGYGTPAAVAHALRHRDAKTVCLVGDGGFMMTGNEMIAAVQHKLPILFILSNNNCYASIRINQEREYPGRVSGTSLFNPDFCQMAQAFGMRTMRLERTEDIDKAIAEGLAANEPVFIEVKSDLAAVLPT